MDKAKLIKKFSQLLNDIENLSNHTDFYSYEKDFVDSFETFGNDNVGQKQDYKN